jgi:hypothetical protein
MHLGIRRNLFPSNGLKAVFKCGEGVAAGQNCGRCPEQNLKASLAWSRVLCVV